MKIIYAFTLLLLTKVGYSTEIGEIFEFSHQKFELNSVGKYTYITPMRLLGDITPFNAPEDAVEKCQKLDHFFVEHEQKIKKCEEDPRSDACPFLKLVLIQMGKTVNHLGRKQLHYWSADSAKIDHIEDSIGDDLINTLSVQKNSDARYFKFPRKIHWQKKVDVFPHKYSLLNRLKDIFDWEKNLGGLNWNKRKRKLYTNNAFLSCDMARKDVDLQMKGHAPIRGFKKYKKTTVKKLWSNFKKVRNMTQGKNWESKSILTQAALLAFHLDQAPGVSKNLNAQWQFERFLEKPTNNEVPFKLDLSLFDTIQDFQKELFPSQKINLSPKVKWSNDNEI